MGGPANQPPETWRPPEGRCPGQGYVSATFPTWPQRGQHVRTGPPFSGARRQPLQAKRPSWLSVSVSISVPRVALSIPFSGPVLRLMRPAETYAGALADWRPLSSAQSQQPPQAHPIVVVFHLECPWRRVSYHLQIVNQLFDIVQCEAYRRLATAVVVEILVHIFSLRKISGSNCFEDLPNSRPRCSPMSKRFACPS